MTAWFDPRGAVATPVQLDLPLFSAAVPADATPLSMPRRARALRGRTAYLAGLAAEDIVARHYAGHGLTVLARRWRGTCAEIDLILQDGAAVIFVEVKKSRSFDAACQSLGRAQQQRIVQAATEFLGQMPKGQLTDTRIDLALVNDQGALEILENAFGEGE
jgi:putative endonuclease